MTDRIVRRAVLLVALVASLTSFAGPAAAAHELGVAGEARGGLSVHSDAFLARNRAAVIAATLSPCADRAYSHIGGRWTKPVHWSFKSGSTPAGLGVNAAEAALVKSFDNITGAFNDCGRSDKVDAEHVYDGRTNRAANISRNANCTPSDGRNVIAFGRLPEGILAVTCTRHFGSFILEADIKINTRYPWAATLGTCNNEELIEPTITHEVGHVFGLGHVGERRHPLMTMSTRSDGECNDAASTLGLGDMLGLEALY